MRGTPTIYQGDELGMVDVHVPPEAVRDPWGLQVPGYGRDPARTPIRWDGAPGSGFTDGEPWLPFGTATPAGDQLDDPRSMLRLHRRLLALRRAEPALAVGDMTAVGAVDGVLHYERRHGERRLGVALNLTSEPRPTPFPHGKLLLSTADVPADDRATTRARLAADEGRVVELAGGRG